MSWLRDGTQGHWDQAADGADPAGYDLYGYGAWTNLALAGNGVFLIGGEYAPAATIRYFDFATHQVTRLMGKTPNGASADSTTPGAPRNKSLSSSCSGWSHCFLAYRAGEDRLYFSEDSKLRYLTTPRATATATLGTLFTSSSGSIANFGFAPDGKQVFYITDGGRLRCHDLGSGKSWCNDGDLGPPAPLPPLVSVPDQLTFEDAGHLFISSGQGEVYRYTLPP